jgi:phosphohistidine phosphatase
LRLYLLRHGIASPRDPRRYPDDSLRPLTSSGKRRLASAARGMRRLRLSVSKIYTSPLRRCVQTAEIIARDLKPSPPVRTNRLLIPGASTARAVGFLSSRPPTGTLLLVGHEPDLSRLASFLLHGGNVTPAMIWKKGGLCRIDFEGKVSPGMGQLAYHVPPRLLRSVTARRARA